jgi:hypothetical protein
MATPPAATTPPCTLSAQYGPSRCTLRSVPGLRWRSTSAASILPADAGPLVARLQRALRKVRCRLRIYLEARAGCDPAQVRLLAGWGRRLAFCPYRPAFNEKHGKASRPPRCVGKTRKSGVPGGSIRICRRTRDSSAFVAARSIRKPVGGTYRAARAAGA